MKKEEELKKSLDEKDKWYKEQLETLHQRVRAAPRTRGGGGGQNNSTLMQLSRAATDSEVTLVLSADRCPGVWRSVSR